MTETAAKATEEDVQKKLLELEQAKTQLAEQVKQGVAAAEETKKRVEQLTGQLTLISEAAKEVSHTPEEAPDLLNDTDKALDFHFRKRTQPIIDANNARAAIQEKEMSKLRHQKDWTEFGGAVEDFVAKNGIPASTLATPGAYDGILKLVKAEKIDEIVKKQVAEQVAAFQESAAKAATASSPAGLKASADQADKREPEMTEAEQAMAVKLGVSKEKWTKAGKDTTYDGLRVRGTVVH